MTPPLPSHGLGGEDEATDTDPGASKAIREAQERVHPDVWGEGGEEGSHGGQEARKEDRLLAAEVGVSESAMNC